MKKFIILAVLLVLVACNFHPDRKEQKQGRLYPAWIMTGVPDSTSLIYLPGKLKVSWFLAGECDDNLRNVYLHIPPGCQGCYLTEKDTSYIAQNYYTGHIHYNGHTILIEIAVNEKEMAIKMKNDRQKSDTVNVIFTVSFPPRFGTGFDQERGIIEADFAGERMFFHHYGHLTGTVYADSLCRSQTLSLSDSIYFYSGDERSVIYLDEMMARKRAEYFAR